jgi:ABC-type transport system involved in multi-copper enzyme maturation permease subunit
MINYIKADLYRIMTRRSFYIWSFAFIVIPAVLLIPASGIYPVETLLAVIPNLIYVVFCMMTLIVTEYTFRDDMQRGVYKNDTTNGVSRTVIYLAKLLGGVLLTAIWWIVSSLSCVVSLTCNVGAEHGFALLENMMSLRMISLFLWAIVFLSLFQTISVVFQRTSALIIVYGAIIAVITNAKELLRAFLPGLAGILDDSDAVAVMGDLSGFDASGLPVLPVLCILGTAVIGSALFRRKEF